MHATHERERKEQHLTHEQTLKPSYQPIKEKTKEALREVYPEKCEGRPGWAREHARKEALHAENEGSSEEALKL